MRPFVITGCGNSGTLYVARLLSSLGIRTAFEEFFTAYTSPADMWHYGRWLKLSDTVGESSSLATPYVRLLVHDCVILHQVRHPIEVLRSLMGRRTFEPDLRLLPNLRFFFRHISEADHDDEPIVLAMKYWLYWNRSIESLSHLRYCVEDMPAALPAIAATIGANIPDPREALDSLGTKCHGGPRDEGVTLESLPDCAVRDDLVRQGERYGYPLRG